MPGPSLVKTSSGVTRGPESSIKAATKYQPELLREARFPDAKTLDQIDWSH